MAGTLEGVVFCEKNDDSTLRTHSLSHSLPDGSCTSVSFEPVTNHSLVSFRPGRLCPQSRHLVGQVVQSSEEFNFPVVHQFQGSPANKLLSKSVLYSKPGDEQGQLFAAFGNESKKTAQIYNCSSGELTQELSGDREPVLDILPFFVNTDSFLSLLTSHKLLIYKWT
jgi:E3 ubiquitin-protein ligase RFWD3